MSCANSDLSRCPVPDFFNDPLGWPKETNALNPANSALTVVCPLLAGQGVVPSELVWIHVVLARLTWVGYVHAWLVAGWLLATSARNRAATALIESPRISTTFNARRSGSRLP